MMPNHWLTPYRLFIASLFLAVALGGACNCNDDPDPDPDPDPDVGVNDVEDDVLPPPPDIPEGIARVQIIHDAADPAAATIDLYAGDTLLVDDFQFRTATPYLDIDAGTYDFTIAGPDSDGVDDGIVTFEGLSFEEQQRYIVVASGLVNPDDFANNPDDLDTALALHLIANTREQSDDPAFDQMLLFHSVTDAPPIDLFADNATTLVSDLGYSDFSDGYLSLPPGITVFDLLVSASGDRVNSYQTPPLGGGDAYTALASGFLDSTQHEDASFAVVVYPSPVGGDRLEAIVLDQAARLQLVHNSVDPAAAEVDIFLNGQLLADQVAFRSASPFLTFPANLDLDFAITAAGAGDPEDSVLRATLEFTPGSSQLAVVSGVLDPADFEDNPDGLPTALALYPLADAREAAAGDEVVDIVAFHGVLDAPAVGVVADIEGTPVEIDEELSYRDFSAYASAPAVDDVALSLLPTSPPPTSLAGFTFDLSDLASQAALIMVSGTLDTGDVAAVVVLPDGTALIVDPDD